MGEAKQLESQAFKIDNRDAAPLRAESVFTSAANSTWRDAMKSSLANAEKSLAPFTIDDNSKPALNDALAAANSHQANSALKGGARSGAEGHSEGLSNHHSLNSALESANRHSANSGLMGRSAPPGHDGATSVQPHRGLSASESSSQPIHDLVPEAPRTTR